MKRVPPPPPKPEIIISMDRYGSIANAAWFAAMSGKLWLITEKARAKLK